MTKSNLFSIFLVCLTFSYSNSSIFNGTLRSSANECPKHPRPIDCEEVLENGYSTSGIYHIWPRSRVTKCQTLRVYCDMETDGGGWTVIQRRGQFSTPEDYFNKNWNEYKNGFGKLKQEFWLGNDNIYALASQGSYNIRFDMTNRNGAFRFSEYERFWIEEEDKNYRLHLGKYLGSNNMEIYAGDALSAHSNRDFYTNDRENIPQGVNNGGRKNPGGWWYNIFPSTNLNGLNKKRDFGGRDNIMWDKFGGYETSMLSTEIKLRSNQF